MTFLGTLPWTAALAIAGYEGGKNWNRIAGPIGIAGLVLAVVLVLVVIGWFVRGRRRPAIAASEATAAGPSRGGGR